MKISDKPPRACNGQRTTSTRQVPLKPIFSTKLGVLYKGDCLEVLPRIESATVTTVFADPPYNLGKHYGTLVNDNLPEPKYLDWCKCWIAECVRTLMAGGTFFLYDLPKWNIILGNYILGLGMNFRHWIAVDMKPGLPIPTRLYPSHYSLLYFTKGKPKTFRKIRVPIEKCRHCGNEIRDYGGHRNAMNPNGVSLTDVWHDISPVRHWKFKSKKRKTNQLSTKFLQRVINLSTDPGDVVLDPFGGSGTTYDVCEMENRRWIGIELESCDLIIERLENGTIFPHKTEDFVEG